MHQIDPMKRERATAVLVDFCHTKLRFRKIKIFWALPWKNLRLLMWPKNPISSYFGQNSEMQNCQDYTDPTVHFTPHLQGDDNHPHPNPTLSIPPTILNPMP